MKERCTHKLISPVVWGIPDVCHAEIDTQGGTATNVSSTVHSTMHSTIPSAQRNSKTVHTT